MNAGFSTLDYVIFVLYAIVILFLGLWVSREKEGKEKNTQEYFLADKSLTWWAVGASLIAANISAEHFIGTSGSGFAIGLAISAYEWIAAVALIIVAKYFLPVFIHRNIYTMPQFLNGRFNRGVSTAFAVFWLLVYVFVNLTSVSYLGALAMEQIMGIPLVYGIIGVLLFSGIYSIYGGLEAVAWTDVVQVVVLIGGGLLTTFLALDAVGAGEGVFAGLGNLYESAREHFTLVVPEGHIMVPDGDGGVRDAFKDLPGVAVIVGAMWATNLGYWGFNQYIIQKGLAAKSINEAKRGLLFAGYLKILMPFIVVIPGIAAYVLINEFTPEQLAAALGKPVEAVGSISKSDEAYPWLLKNFIPSGVRGLAFAALAAAIVSSLASMVNSTSTIFTMDIYRHYFKPEATDRQLVKAGRVVAIIALLIAMVVAPQLSSLDQVFQYIQEYTGYIYPGVLVVFAMGLFWTQITPNAALWTAIATIPAGIAFKLISPDMPFLMRMGYVFIILCVIASVISFMEKGHKIHRKLPEPGRQRKLLAYSYLFLALGVITLVATVVLSGEYNYMGVESAYFLAVLFIMLGIILYTNAKMKLVDKKAIVSDPVLFNTGTPFNIGAAGIILIVGLLYYFFWY
ncbi:SSS family solute:Na+ symporter [Pontibacter ummariensis]|uniref:Solute:Na+ symporter, SSS family n=1 Tax=Pontibacter ummariensis TaxID=1610492 RepID=A0A239K1M3_9BACT|nr:sodium/sugar symporter [Pontibacter ummariensis]PRY06845.1 SSS family solute:Na+ symporter [Pontibacter ummariensis]SNT12226.1 solute:Na+ symporter, SSS family [Pontibacter ummariensis]